MPPSYAERGGQNHYYVANSFLLMSNHQVLCTSYTPISTICITNLAEFKCFNVHTRMRLMHKATKCWQSALCSRVHYTSFVCAH